MLNGRRTLRVCFLALALGVMGAVPLLGGSAVVGSVAGSMNATIGGQALLPNTTIFSGDSIDVRDGVAVVALDKASRMVFGRETTASFLKSSDEVTVLLSRGNLSMYHTDEGVALRVKIGDLSVSPAKGFKSLGEVAMVGGSIVVTTKEGTLRVEGRGPAQEVAKGKTITIPVTSARAPKAGAGAGPVGGGGTSTALEAGALGAGAAAAILSGISISRANSAKDAATAANATAAQAVTQATAAATSAATAANQATIAATDAGIACKTVSPNAPCL